MRNPERIPKILAQLSVIWRLKASDWRFMQLISNFQSYLGYDGFYLEDERFIEELEKYLEGIISNEA